MDELLLRELAPAVIGVLVRRGVGFATAEDAVQEALIQASLTWPDRPPADPRALTLRAVGGLTTRQIAQAYLVPEATMAQRISRAKRTVGDVRFDQPGDLATVLRVLYPVFNEGYSGDVDLAAEAIRDYVVTPEWQVSEIQAALIEADAGPFASDADVAVLYPSHH